MADRMKVSGPFVHIQIGPPEDLVATITSQLKRDQPSVVVIPSDSWLIFRVPEDKLLAVGLKLKTICDALGFEIELDDCR